MSSHVATHQNTDAPRPANPPLLQARQQSHAQHAMPDSSIQSSALWSLWTLSCHVTAGGAEVSEAAPAPASKPQDPSADAPDRLQILAVQDAQSAVYLMTSGGFQLARLQTSLPAPCSLVCLPGPSACC